VLSEFTWSDERKGERRERHQAEDQAEENAPHCYVNVFRELVLLGEQSQTAFLVDRHSAFIPWRSTQQKIGSSSCATNREGATAKMGEYARESRERNFIFPVPVLRHLKSLEGQAGVANPTRRQSNIPLPCFTSRRDTILYPWPGNPCCFGHLLTFLRASPARERERKMLLLFSGAAANLAINKDAFVSALCTTDEQKMSTFGQIQLRCPWALI
jgi:hypothetical protein